MNYVTPQLDLLKKKFIREYTGKAIAGDLDTTIIKKDILSARNDQKLEKIIRRNVGYNIEHIFPVLIYRIKKLFVESRDNGKIKFIVTNDDAPSFFKSLIEAIYQKYVAWKLRGLPTSLTTVVRSPEFYEIGEEAYITLKNTLKLEESDFIERNKYIGK